MDSTAPRLHSAAAACPPCHLRRFTIAVAWLVVAANAAVGRPAEALEEIRVSQDRSGFVLAPSGRPFTPWGFNYDHDAQSRLLEEYWQAEWATVEQDFQEMKRLGANLVRIHPQLGKFMQSADQPNEQSLARLAKLVELAERTGLYLDLTGLGCYHRAEIPPWYDGLDEAQRWQVQARFWEAIAQRCAPSPAVFCYDLMNEPVAPNAPQKPGNWLVGPPFGGKQFVQFISLDPKDRARARIAQQWVQTLVAAIRRHDKRHLISVGLLPGTPDRADAWSGFDPKLLADDLDFFCVHMYPEKGRVDEALKILSRFSVGKPVVVEETFPLKCSGADLEAFIDAGGKYASGWVGFYWGKTLDELRASKQFGDVLTVAWLELFEKKSKQMAKP